MAIETRPIPTLARSAVNLARAAFQNTVNQLGVETTEAMGLPSDEGWRVNFTDGVAIREVPDDPKTHQPLGTELATTGDGKGGN